MKQECPIVNIYANWVLYLGVLGFVVYRRDWVFAGTWAAIVPVGLWLYVRNFPKISHLIGYGKLDDRLVSEVGQVSAKVRFYTALGCPFCPVVEQRLHALQQKMGFTLEKIDITLKPELLSGAGIRSIPVVEVENRRLVGNATTEQLAELISHTREAAAVAS
jgi:thiol-disulfide isomerase/thioredoxin